MGGVLRHYTILIILYSLCLRYDEELGVVYMAARLAGCYAAVRRAVNEVPEKNPSNIHSSSHTTAPHLKSQKAYRFTFVYSL